LPIHSSTSAAAAAEAGHTTVAARAAPQRGCVGRRLANRNEMSVSRSDSYALLFFSTINCTVYKRAHMSKQKQSKQKKIAQLWKTNPRVA